MLNALTISDLGGGLNCLDIGASGGLEPKWRAVERWINLFAFEPNQVKCAKLAAHPSRFHSAAFLPYAVGGENHVETFYNTSSVYCGSLLQPNTPWLRRFSFGGLFDVIDTSPVPTRRLSDIAELHDVDVDAIKVDTQGLELPILSHAGDVLERAFYVETETGFVENYVGETTYAEIDLFMRSKGFLLFDINPRHRISRNNQFRHAPTGSEQILWCEAVWLKDYVALAERGEATDLTREKALKILVLCALQRCLDFGYELARAFHQLDLLSDNELNSLSRRGSWSVARPSLKQFHYGLMRTALRALPRRTRRRMAREVDASIEQADIVKSIRNRLKGRHAA